MMKLWPTPKVCRGKACLAPTVLILLLVGVLSTRLIAAQDTPTVITLDAPWTITAGDEWSLTVIIDGAAAGTKADTTLITGLRRYDAELTLGSGGIARWDVGAVVSAGAGVVIVRFGDQQVRHALIVQPAPAETLQALTTANNLPAYGEGQGIVIALVEDAWGNLIEHWLRATITADYPAADSESYPLRYASGLFWTWLPSGGEPGRVLLTMNVDAATDMFELRQVPGEAQYILLHTSMRCLEQTDGRDVLTLTARVTDSHREPVIDGTLVTFAWEDGRGSASVVNGQATLEIPARAGTYQALTGNVVSSRMRLGAC